MRLVGKTHARVTVEFYIDDWKRLATYVQRTNDRAGEIVITPESVIVAATQGRLDEVERKGGGR